MYQKNKYKLKDFQEKNVSNSITFDGLFTLLTNHDIMKIKCQEKMFLRIYSTILVFNSILKVVIKSYVKLFATVK